MAQLLRHEGVSSWHHLHLHRVSAGPWKRSEDWAVLAPRVVGAGSSQLIYANESRRGIFIKLHLPLSVPRPHRAARQQW